MNDSKDIDGNDDADWWCLGFRVLLEEECCGDADDAVHSGQENHRTGRCFCKPKYIKCKNNCSTFYIFYI
jgi:hypothetical protein